MKTIELLNTLIENRIEKIHVCLPGIIVDYDYTKQRAKVQPSINKNYNNEILELPIIHNVPVIQPSSGGASITFPVNIGDSVCLIFSEKSLEEWLNKGGDNITPDDPRINDITDAVAFIGLNSFSQSSSAENNTDLLIKYKGSKITIKESGVIDLESPTVNINSNNVNVTGKITAENIEANSEIKSSTASIGGKDFATHTHSNVTPGSGISGIVT